VTILAAMAIGVTAAALVLVASPSPPGPRAQLLHAHLRARAILERWREREWRGRAAAGAVGVLHGTHAALRSGLPLALAVRVALSDLDPRVRAPFDRALRAFDLGAALEAALGDAAAGAHDRRVAVALEALALVAGERLPASRAAAVVASAADRLTFEDRLLAEVRARTAGLRAQIVILALLVPALALYLVASLPGLAETLATPLGAHVLVPAALLFEAVGILVSRAIVRELRP
jgi:Flp pilus assembly protein TadB